MTPATDVLISMVRILLDRAVQHTHTVSTVLPGDLAALRSALRLFDEETK